MIPRGLKYYCKIDDYPATIFAFVQSTCPLAISALKMGTVNDLLKTQNNMIFYALFLTTNHQHIQCPFLLEHRLNVGGSLYHIYGKSYIAVSVLDDIHLVVRRGGFLN